MELADFQAMRILAGEDLKASMYKLSMDAVHTDVKLVCYDGIVQVHKAELLLYVPEIANWIPEHSFSFDITIILGDQSLADIQSAVKQIYLDDEAAELRAYLGLDTPNVLLQHFDHQDQEVVQEEDHHDLGEDTFVEVNLGGKNDITMEVNLGGKEDTFVGVNLGGKNDIPMEEEPEDTHEESNPEVPYERMKYTKLFPCPGCDKIFTTSHYLKVHEMKAHDNSTLVSTHRCLAHPDMVFENINRLTAHFNTEHSQRLIRELIKKGGAAKVTSVRKRKEKVDLKMETMELLQEVPIKQKDFICSFCPNFSTDKEDSLKNHIELCHTPVQCPQCDKMISSKRNLSSHISYIHKVEGTGHVCQECGKEYPTIQSLRKHHEAKHAVEKKYKCDECPKSYGTKTILKEHIESKHRDARYPCATCGKSFGSKSLLRGHENTHVEFKKFGCDECDKRFRTREKLRNHQSVHSNVKHPCLVCGSQFSRLETLKVHMKIHDESKALKCSECGKLFDTSQKYKEHMNTHTGDKPFICTACGSAFSSSSSLCHHKKNCAYNQKLSRLDSLANKMTGVPISISKIGHLPSSSDSVKTEVFYI